jgi:hypothetical protein
MESDEDREDGRVRETPAIGRAQARPDLADGRRPVPPQVFHHPPLERPKNVTLITFIRAHVGDATTGCVVRWRYYYNGRS